MNIIVAGDFHPRFQVASLFENKEFDAVLGEIKPFLENVDYAIVNFECAVSEPTAQGILKNGPCLRCSEHGLEAIKWAGFDCITLANNHFRDYGNDGVINTLEYCNSLGIDYVGGGRDLQEASEVLYKKINGKTLAIINCCEHEFSIATATRAGCNPLDPVQQFYSIKEAKDNADYVLVIVHGGFEHYQLPGPRMQEAYRFFIDAGADAIVNHHQHCFSGYEVYKGKPIFYGLGNFCIASQKQKNRLWYEGYMVMLMFGEVLTFDWIPYRQCFQGVSIHLVEKSEFQEKMNHLNGIIAVPELLKKNTDVFFESRSNSINLLFEPFGGIINKLQQKGIIPSLLSKKRLMKLYNIICCESHRDKIIFNINHQRQ